MKFCPKRTITYQGLNQIETTAHYVTYNDVREFHGQEFANQWLVFSEKLPKFLVENKECYYYSDYKFIAYRTDLFLSAT